MATTVSEDRVHTHKDEVMLQGGGRVMLPPEEDFDYGEDAGGGLANVGADDLLIPRMLVAQPTTPEVVEGTVEGLKPGSLFIRQLGMIHFPGAPGPIVVLCGQDRSYNIFHPRDGDGPKGFVTTVKSNHPVGRRLKAATPFGKISLTHEDLVEAGWDAAGAIPGDQFVETYNVFCLLMTPDQMFRIVFPCASTHITPIRALLTNATSLHLKRPNGSLYQPPLYAFRRRVSTRFHREGTQTWFKIDLPFADGDMLSSRLTVTSEAYVEARKFSESILKGEVRVDMSDVDRDATRDDATRDDNAYRHGPTHADNLGDGDVPF